MTTNAALAAFPDDPTLDRAMVERAAELRPLLRTAGAQADEDRRLPDELVQALHDADLYRLCVPRRYGGLEGTVHTLVATTAEVARGDGGAGWVHALINSGAWIASTYGEQAQDDVWGADPEARVCTVLDPTESTERVDGGYVVSGRWGFGSGSLHSQWANVGLMTVGADGEAEQCLALVPFSELSIEDTWFVAGMRGSGSNTIVAENVFVPDHRIQRFADLQADVYATASTEPAARASFNPVLGLILCGAQLGLAQAAIDLTLDGLPRRSIRYSRYTRAIDSPTNQVAIAEVVEALDVAWLLARRACADIDSRALQGVSPDHLVRARIRMDTGVVVTECRNVIDRVLSMNGAASFATGNPLQRIWRDSETASRHGLIQPEISKEIYGMALFGIDDHVMPL